MVSDISDEKRKNKKKDEEVDTSALNSLFSNPENMKGRAYSETPIGWDEPMRNMENAIINADTHKNGVKDNVLDKKEILAAAAQLEASLGTQMPEELKAKLASMPDDFTVSVDDALSQLHGLKVNMERIQNKVAASIENGDSLSRSLSVAMDEAKQIKQELKNPERGQNIDEVMQKIANTLHRADDGKGWTAFENDGVLKGKEIDTVIEKLSKHPNDPVAMALKADFELARAHGQSINIEDALANASVNLNGFDGNRSGILNPTELAALTDASRYNGLN